MDELRMAVARMLIQQDMVLHEEVRNIVVQIDILADDVHANQLVTAVHGKAHEVGGGTFNGILDIAGDAFTVEHTR